MTREEVNVKAFQGHSIHKEMQSHININDLSIKRLKDLNVQDIKKFILNIMNELNCNYISNDSYRKDISLLNYTQLIIPDGYCKNESVSFLFEAPASSKDFNHGEEPLYFEIDCYKPKDSHIIRLYWTGMFFTPELVNKQYPTDVFSVWVNRRILDLASRKSGWNISDFIIETCNQFDKPEKPEILCSGPDKLNDTGNCPSRCHGNAPVREKEDSKDYEFYKSTSLDAPHKLVLNNVSSFALNSGKCFVKTITKELINRRDSVVTENICSVSYLLHTINGLPDDGIDVLYASGDSYQSWDNHSIFAGFTNGKNSEDIKIVFEDVKPSIILSDGSLQFDWSGTFRVFQIIEKRYVNTNKSEIDRYFTRHNRLDGILALDFLKDILSPERYQEIYDFCNNKSADDFVKRDVFSNTAFDKINRVHYLKINDIFYNKEKCHHFTYFLLEDKLDSKNEYEDSKYSLYMNTYYDRIYNVKPVCYLDKN